MNSYIIADCSVFLKYLVSSRLKKNIASRVCVVCAFVLCTHVRTRMPAACCLCLLALLTKKQKNRGTEIFSAIFFTELTQTTWKYDYPIKILTFGHSYYISSVFETAINNFQQVLRHSVKLDLSKSCYYVVSKLSVYRSNVVEIRCLSLNARDHALVSTSNFEGDSRRESGHTI